MHQQRIPHARHSVAHCSLGAAVRELRARYGLSQERFGELSGLHRNYIGAIERGEVNPTFLTLLRITSSIEIRLSGLIVLYERREAETVAARRIGTAH
jgi:transcriptional regulator with XRE-family HTH domain